MWTCDDSEKNKDDNIYDVHYDMSKFQHIITFCKKKELGRVRNFTNYFSLIGKVQGQLQ